MKRIKNYKPEWIQPHTTIYPVFDDLVVGDLLGKNGMAFYVTDKKEYMITIRNMDPNYKGDGYTTSKWQFDNTSYYRIYFPLSLLK